MIVLGHWVNDGIPLFLKRQLLADCLTFNQRVVFIHPLVNFGKPTEITKQEAELWKRDFASIARCEELMRGE